MMECPLGCLSSGENVEGVYYGLKWRKRHAVTYRLPYMLQDQLTSVCF